MRSLCFSALLCLCALVAQAQDVRLPRTIKFYPLQLFRGELTFGYEHGLRPNLSLSFQAGVHGSGSFSQVDDKVGNKVGEGCQLVWAASGVGLKAGTRWYPSKIKRGAPFYMELLLAYRRTQFQAIDEYPDYPCDPQVHSPKEIRPLVQRVGLNYLIGGALRRDRRFTLDMYGGLGFNVVFTDEQQSSIPPLVGEFYQIESPRVRSSPTLHLGMTLGYNMNGARRR